jgi:3-methyladenine DNA glycosylase AlkC
MNDPNISEKFSLKDHLFNPKKVSRLSSEIKTVYPKFDKQGFDKAVLSQFPQLELKARISHMSACLAQFLPQPFEKAVAVILKALPPCCDPTLSDDDFGDFIYAPYCDFVAKNGCTSAYLSLSLEALKAITTRFSAEDAIRYFINAFPEHTLPQLLTWTQDSHYHVRRLASEGSRPKLPWAQKINLPYQEALPILHKLYRDPTRFVTRSVANHLNDISKIEPDAVISLLREWKKQPPSPKEWAFLYKHALRTLVKKGHPQALAFFEVAPPRISDVKLTLSTPTLHIGDTLSFTLQFKSLAAQSFIVDYAISFIQKNGQLSKPKVYKLKGFTALENQDIYLLKKHPLKANMSTRTLYAGVHRVEVVVNGQEVARSAFDLRS